MSERDTVGSRAAWAVAITDEQYAAERLIHHDTLELTGVEKGRSRPGAGDEVLVVLDGQPPRVVALGRVRPADDADQAAADAPLVVAYTRRAFDEPVPANELVLDAAVTPLDPATHRRLADRLGSPAPRRTWLVSLDLPIEASSAAEAARMFWSYVFELGPRELPAFVAPMGNELAMRAYVLGEETNQDPEEDD